DVAEREKEEDDVIDEESYDPRCPPVLFTAAQKIKWRREWRSTLIVKGLGRDVPYIPLAKRLNYLLARHGDIQISDLQNGCFLVKFRDQRDYQLAAEGGPWLMGDTYLTVHWWYKEFNLWKATVKSAIVWVQLPYLPIEFFNAEAVTMIAELIGTPIRVDRATEIGARGNYARVSVEVDLTKPLLGKYKVEGITYLIQYEGLDDICGECGLYGNHIEKCHCCIMEEQPPSPIPEYVPETPGEDQAETRVYGDWMIVKRKQRRYEQRAIPTNKRVDGNTMGRHENRFHAFQEDEVRQTGAKVTEKKSSETYARKNQQERVEQNVPPSEGNKPNAAIRNNVPNNSSTKLDPKVHVRGSNKVGGKGVQGMQERDAHAGHVVHVPL
ncbi:unnamed protein product, partial [Linum tenue]